MRDSTRSVIWKEELKSNITRFSVDSFKRILSIGTVTTSMFPCVWYEKTIPEIERLGWKCDIVVYAVWTGSHFNLIEGSEFIGTIVDSDGMVNHFYWFKLGKSEKTPEIYKTQPSKIDE